MGLDFMLYKRKIVNSGEEPEYKDDSELAYGRKSWELVRELIPNINEDYKAVVTLESWDRLMKKLEPVGDKLEAIWDAFEREENAPDDYPEFVFTKEHKKLIAEYEYWYNKTFNDTPTLGYFFSVGYMLSFWEAKDEVRKYIEDPEYEVIALASY